jgi:hypothetical protein
VHFKALAGTRVEPALLWQHKLSRRGHIARDAKPAKEVNPTLRIKKRDKEREGEYLINDAHRPTRHSSVVTHHGRAGGSSGLVVTQVEQVGLFIEERDGCSAAARHAALHKVGRRLVEDGSQ